MLADMIVKPISHDDDVYSWEITRGSRTFRVFPNHRGEWSTTEPSMTGDAVRDVSGDLSGSLEYIDSLFN